MYTIEEKQVGRFNVKVHLDDCYMRWGDVLCDGPIMVLSKGRHGVHILFDGSKQVPSCPDLFFNLEDGDVEGSIWNLDGRADFCWTDAGRFRLDSDCFQRPRYFKGADAGLRSLARDVAGLDLRDLRFERFSTQDAEVLLVWSQSELDRYAGTKDAKAPIETVRAYLDGDVYGFTVEDADGDVLESCWGFIGDSSYCMAEGESVARYLEGEACKTDARLLEASRPDLYA